nr:EST-YD1 [Homo sapiens]
MLCVSGFTSNLYSSKKDDKMKEISRTSNWGSSFSEKSGCMQTHPSMNLDCRDVTYVMNLLLIASSSSSSMTKKKIVTMNTSLGQNK